LFRHLFYKNIIILYNAFLFNVQRRQQQYGK
jgi:hypothetical protein